MKEISIIENPFLTYIINVMKEIYTFSLCRLVVGGSAMALKILAVALSPDASFCSTRNLSIHGFASGTKMLK